MKVIFQQAKFSQNQNFKTKQKTSTPFIQKNSQLSQLSNNSMIGRSLVSFGADNIDVDAIKRAKQELTQKRDMAQSKLNKANSWNYWSEKSWYEKQAEDEIERKGLNKGWFKGGKKRDIRDSWMNKFYEKDNEIDAINAKRNEYQQIVDMANAALKDSDAKISLGEKLNNLNDVQSSLNAMLSATGGLHQRIAGYGNEKSKIERIFVNPLAESKRDDKVKVPSAILLHGATGTGKTTFLDSIAEQSRGNVVVVDYTEDTDSDTLVKDFTHKLREARERYLEEGNDEVTKKTRTILLINEAEKILAMTPEYAKEHLDYKLDDADMALLEQYGNDTNLVANVNRFKGYLDHCSQAPEGEDDTTRGGLTIFITTNYPHLIHPDLLTRDGKLPYIAINPADGANIEAVVKHYAKLNSQALEAAKTIKDNDYIDRLVGLTTEAKTKLKEYKNNGRLNELKIDYEAIPYDIIAKVNKPTSKLGAYSNDRYRKISEEAFQKYLEKPELPYYTHLTKTIMTEKRDIGPARYNKFYEIHRLLAPLEIGEREELVNLEKTQALNDKLQGRLEYIRALENADKENLLAKQQLGQITEEEVKRLEEIEHYQKLDKMSFEEYFDVKNDDSDDEDW